MLIWICHASKVRPLSTCWCVEVLDVNFFRSFEVSSRGSSIFAWTRRPPLRVSARLNITFRRLFMWSDTIRSEFCAYVMVHITSCKDQVCSTSSGWQITLLSTFNMTFEAKESTVHISVSSAIFQSVQWALVQVGQRSPSVAVCITVKETTNEVLTSGGVEQRPTQRRAKLAWAATRMTSQLDPLEMEQQAASQNRQSEDSFDV